MVEFTRVLHLTLIKSDLALEEDIARVLGGSQVDPEEFYRSYLDDGLLDHFSGSWTVEAPLAVWKELESVLSTPPSCLVYDEELFYVPDGGDLGEVEESVIAHIEKNTEDAYQRYIDLVTLGTADSISELVIPQNLMKKKLVTMTGLEVISALRDSRTGSFSAATAVILSGLGKVFEECSPIINKILEEDDAFSPN